MSLNWETAPQRTPTPALGIIDRLILLVDRVLHEALKERQ